MAKTTAEFYSLHQSQRSLLNMEGDSPVNSSDILTRKSFPAFHNQPARVHSLARRAFRSLRSFDLECSKISEPTEESANSLRECMKIASGISSCASSSDEEAWLSSIEDKVDDENEKS
jgi:hypothetical protein